MTEDLSEDTNPQGRLFAAGLFVAIFLFFWVGTTPFPDLGGYIAAGAGAATSNLLNQAVILLISVLVIAMLTLHPSRSLAMQAFVPAALVLGYMALTLVMVPGADSASRRLIFACLTCLSASAVLILPRDDAQFARLIGGCLAVVLFLCYFGIVVLPQRSIHQLSDAMEPALAGDWRGYFSHKNMTAACMVVTVFFSLYLIRKKLIWIGAPLAIFATLLLIKTGGKTSAAMLPAIMFTTWIFERMGPLRLVFVIGAVGLLNVTILSVAASPPIRDFVAALGVDPTFTDRAAIWVLALSSISQRPLTGYGFQSFWESDALVYGSHASSTWAVNASSAHNAYLDQLISGGWPLLLLTIIWLVVFPARHAGMALQRGADPDLTRLYLRIWLFVLFAGSFESFFLDASGPIWFTMLIAVFGLRLQAHAQLVEKPADAAFELRPA